MGVRVRITWGHGRRAPAMCLAPGTRSGDGRWRSGPGCLPGQLTGRRLPWTRLAVWRLDLGHST